MFDLSKLKSTSIIILVKTAILFNLLIKYDQQHNVSNDSFVFFYGYLLSDHKGAPVSCSWIFFYSTVTAKISSTLRKNAGCGFEFLIHNVDFFPFFLVPAPFSGSKLGHHLQTSYNNNANSLVQDPSNLFHQ